MVDHVDPLVSGELLSATLLPLAVQHTLGNGLLRDSGAAVEHLQALASISLKKLSGERVEPALQGKRPSPFLRSVQTVMQHHDLVTDP